MKVTCNLLLVQSSDLSVLTLLDFAEPDGDREHPYFYKWRVWIKVKGGPFKDLFCGPWKIQFIWCSPVENTGLDSWPSPVSQGTFCGRTGKEKANTLTSRSAFQSPWLFHLLYWSHILQVFWIIFLLSIFLCLIFLYRSRLYTVKTESKAVPDLTCLIFENTFVVPLAWHLGPALYFFH